ncbi:hypothetical protein GCM10009119_38700 [Algoriphagus jejuensis]|uniref:Glycosyltransferase RgtA/B/C/D-like domain-containing protein n=1 Tax=Algoriphagus jejuensis TaxID=419934 RepID=A0ABP3YHC8_9BACT
MVKLLASASVVCILIVLAGVNRGFDISDEGLYVLLADPLQNNIAGIFNYDLFFKLFFQITGHSFSLAELRIIRLISYFVGALALAGFWKNIQEESRLSAEIFCIAFLGLLVGYAFLPPSLSYNSLTVVLVCCWLKLISQKQLSLKSLLLLGLVLGFLVYIKVSLALILFPLTIGILFLGKKGKPILFVAMLIPFLLLELVFLMVLNENVVDRLQEGIPLNSLRPGYQLKTMLLSIGVGGFWILISGLLGFALGYFNKKKSSFLPAVKIIGVYGFAVICYVTHITDEWNHLILLVSSVLFGFFVGEGDFKLIRVNLWVLLLLALPFLLHFGSNVYWLRIGVHYWVFWILALRWMLKFPYWEMNFGLSALAILLVFNGIWWHPFGQNSSLWKKTTVWNRNERETLYLDPELVAVLNGIKKSTINDHSKPLLAAYRIPGLIWLSGLQTPYSPGIWDKSQLTDFFEFEPGKMIYNGLDSLPENWHFTHRQNLGVYQADSLLLLWD